MPSAHSQDAEVRVYQVLLLLEERYSDVFFTLDFLTLFSGLSTGCCSDSRLTREWFIPGLNLERVGFAHAAVERIWHT